MYFSLHPEEKANEIMICNGGIIPFIRMKKLNDELDNIVQDVKHPGFEGGDEDNK